MKKYIVLFVFVVALALAIGSPHAQAASGQCDPIPTPVNYWYFDWGEMPGEMDRYIFVDLNSGDQVRIVGRPGDERTDPEFYLDHVVSNSGCIMESFQFGVESVDYLNTGILTSYMNQVKQKDPDYIDFLDEARWLR